MIRGEILDSPLKGKMTETCIAEGRLSMVWCGVGSDHFFPNPHLHLADQFISLLHPHLNL